MATSAGVEKLSVRFLCKSTVSRVGFFLCRVYAKSVLNASNSATSFPPPFGVGNTLVSRGVIFTLFYVVLVLGNVCWTQIKDSVIRFISVNVVKVLRRKRPIHKQPSQSMPFIRLAVYSNGLVTILVKPLSCSLPRRHRADLNPPDKHAGVWVVIQNKFKVFLSEHLSIQFKYHPEEVVAGNWMGYSSTAKSSHGLIIA